MARAIAAVTVLVPSYGEGIDFYVRVCGFSLIENSDLGGGKRWVLVAPEPVSATRLLLAAPTDDAQRRAVGNQTGGRVFLFLTTDDFDRDHARMRSAGVAFLEAPRLEAYGKVAVFADPFGNRWDLIG